MSRFNALLLKETKDGRLFRVVDREVWIPKSLTASITKMGLPDQRGNRECIVDVMDWFAEKHDL